MSLFTIESLVTYSILIAVALTLFLTSVWSIHTASVVAQERELATIRRHSSRARGELRLERADPG